MPSGPRKDDWPGTDIDNTPKSRGVAGNETQGELSRLLSTAAAELGRKGGMARARKLTPEQRKEIARKAAETRWAKGS